MTDFIVTKMKIFYTSGFKTALSIPYNNVRLGKYKLQEGNRLDPDTTTLTTGVAEKLVASSSPTNGYYNAQIIEVGEGLQLSLDIPESDQSLYVYGPGSDQDSLYQVILFFYEDDAKGEKLAFLLYDKFEDRVFTGLNLTSRKNIINIPRLDRKCNLILEQSDVTKILESDSPVEIRPVTGKENPEDEDYYSKYSWEKYWVDSISKEHDLRWTETTFLNNFGLKIY